MSSWAVLQSCSAEIVTWWVDGKYKTLHHETALILLSAILNPRAKHYAKVKAEWDRDYEDNYWAEDAIFLERNSRNFASRADKINQNAERICDLLLSHPRGIRASSFPRALLTWILVKDVFYPKHVATRSNYDACRTEKGGYGGLLSVTFHAGPDAIKFYDSIEVDKGPSLGTNFTLRCDYYWLPLNLHELILLKLPVCYIGAFHRTSMGKSHFF